MVVDGPYSGSQSSFMQATGYWITHDWPAYRRPWICLQVSLTGWDSAPTSTRQQRWSASPVKWLATTWSWPTGGR